MTEEQRRLAEAYLPAAENYIRRTYRPVNRDIFDQFMSAAGEALVEAAIRFDPEKGENFWTYARWWVWKFCNQHIEGTPIIKQPRSVLRGDEDVTAEVVAPLVEAGEDLGRSAADIFGIVDDGYADVEAALMREWVTKVMDYYSVETQTAWLEWRTGESGLPADEERRILVTMLDDELREGMLD